MEDKEIFYEMNQYFLQLILNLFFIRENQEGKMMVQAFINPIQSKYNEKNIHLYLL